LSVTGRALASDVMEITAAARAQANVDRSLVEPPPGE